MGLLQLIQLLHHIAEEHGDITVAVQDGLDPSDLVPAKGIKIHKQILLVGESNKQDILEVHS